ncbi:Outer membrane receptor protein [Pseudomonas syringae pv. actinidiae]|uniref:Outer membrane receptor protein n=1 Tax=Pseudomonas syringae pv. actinidiae TaxID=103796 RepID=A0AAN4TMM6_PSESF|nr:Outer membrane receptor protein [Pseudomonas syringae pv. actinidiae]
MGPGIVVEHRDLDDAGLQRALGDRTGLGLANGVEQRMRRDTVRVKTNLERGVGQAHVEHTVQRQALDCTGHRQPLEKGFQRHAVTDLGKQVLISAKAVANRIGHVCSF